MLNLDSFSSIRKRLIFGLATSLFLTACTVEPAEVTTNSSGYPNGTVTGYKPIYGKDVRDLPIEQIGPKTIEQAGKIFYKNGYLFLIANNKGIHILDNRNPANPINLDFIAIPGVQDMSMSGSYLYADSYNDLLVFDLSTAPEIKLLQRQVNILESEELDIQPPARGQYFECVDQSKGEVVAWEITTITNPRCRN